MKPTNVVPILGKATPGPSASTVPPNSVPMPAGGLLLKMRLNSPSTSLQSSGLIAAY